MALEFEENEIHGFLEDLGELQATYNRFAQAALAGICEDYEMES
jgi:hypothetical protein